MPSIEASIEQMHSHSLYIPINIILTSDIYIPYSGNKLSLTYVQMSSQSALKLYPLGKECELMHF